MGFYSMTVLVEATFVSTWPERLMETAVCIVTRCLCFQLSIVPGPVLSLRAPIVFGLLQTIPKVYRRYHLRM